MTRISICPGSRLPTIRHKSLCKQTENSACIAPTKSQLPQRSLLSSFDCEDKCLSLRTRIACIVLCPVADTSSTSCWKGCRSALLFELGGTFKGNRHCWPPAARNRNLNETSAPHKQHLVFPGHCASSSCWESGHLQYALAPYFEAVLERSRSALHTGNAAVAGCDCQSRQPIGHCF